MEHTDCYIVAGCIFAVIGDTLPEAVINLPGFDVFSFQGTDVLFRFEQRLLEAAPHQERLLFEVFHEGCRMKFSTCVGGHLLVMEKSGDYLKLWRTESGVVHVAGSHDPQMLKFALWIGYGLETIALRRIPMHCSCIVKDGLAYLFLGESGTGKSTHTRLWRENVEGAFLLNDDSPVLAVEDGEVWMYGSPWSGKTHCYRLERYRLGGCVRLSQAPYNKIERLSLLKAFAAVHPSCPPQFSMDPGLYDEVGMTLSAVLKSIGIWHLACLPNPEAALLSYETLIKEHLNHED